MIFSDTGIDGYAFVCYNLDCLRISYWRFIVSDLWLMEIVSIVTLIATIALIVERITARSNCSYVKNTEDTQINIGFLERMQNSEKELISLLDYVEQFKASQENQQSTTPLS